MQGPHCLLDSIILDQCRNLDLGSRKDLYGDSCLSENSKERAGYIRALSQAGADNGNLGQSGFMGKHRALGRRFDS